MDCLIWFFKQKSFQYLSAAPVLCSRRVHPQRKTESPSTTKRNSIFVRKLNHRGSDPLREQKLSSICLGNERLNTEVVLVGWKSGFFFFVVDERKWNNLEIRKPNLGVFVCLFNRFFSCNRWLAVDEEDGKVQLLLVITD